MKLSTRKKVILCRAIEEFIKDSSPITSSNVKDAAALDCSTATLRNELNSLEAMGFLRQLHTSGGRVPTPQGYRFYVEQLLQGLKATDVQLEQVQQLISSRTNSLLDMVTGIAKIVSEATNYPTVVLLSGIENLVLTEIKIIPMLEQKAMVLIGTTSGYVNSTLDIKASLQECQDASAYLTKTFQGFTIGDMVENVEAFKFGMKEEIKAFQSIVDGLVGGLRRLNEQRVIDVHREGTIKLLENSTSIEEAKKVINLLDDNDGLENALSLSQKEGIEVDVADEEGKVASVVKAPIVVGGKQLASIGVIGPQRMDYNKIASALKLVIDELENIKGDD